MLTTRKFGDDEAGPSGIAGGSGIAVGSGVAAGKDWRTSGVPAPAPAPQAPATRLPSGLPGEAQRRPGPTTPAGRGEGERAGAAAPLRAEAQPLPLADVSTLHILIVDDDDSLRGACCEIARNMGFTVHGAESVPAARAILKH